MVLATTWMGGSGNEDSEGHTGGWHQIQLTGPFTYERVAAQRCQVTQMESHSTWVAEPGRVQGSWSGCVSESP